MGPLELADLIGLDICLDIMEVLYDSFKDSKYRPCPLLRQMVDGAGWEGNQVGASMTIRPRRFTGAPNGECSRKGRDHE